MRFSTSAVFACAVAFVAAQDLSSLPSCALPCFAAAIQGSGCALSDTKCQCTTGNAKITESITACAPSKCSAGDLAKIAPAAAGICSAAGFANAIPSAAISSAAAVASSAAGAASSAVGSVAASASRAASSVVASASASRSASASSALPQSTGAASGIFVNGALVIAMGVLAL